MEPQSKAYIYRNDIIPENVSLSLDREMVDVYTDTYKIYLQR